ncbi:hypothetical protein K7432_007086 [Basidiobolus ranarum]|uniref:Uncharacterized protein n=1 Tax=Basidiobolus ranarum TaxID=34480 RepID=A0ABR2WTZ1_9FUNG
MNKHLNATQFPSIEPEPKPHTNITEVERTMKDMDSKYNTQFYSWIRNERNVDYIAYYLQRLIVDVSDTPSQSIPSVIRWLVNGWSIQHTAELLIKLFYHWGIGHLGFASMVTEVTQDWSSSNVLDLVITLVIGERASKTAKFVKHLTNNWEPRAIMNTVRQLSLRLKWSERYFKHFLLQYFMMCEEEHAHQRMTVSKLRSCFESRQNTLNHWCTIDTENSYQTLLSLIEFSMEIFETIVWEMYELRYFRKWNILCPKGKSCSGEEKSSIRMRVPVNRENNGLRIVTNTDQYMDLRGQYVFEKLASPQTAVHTEYFAETSLS